MLLSPLARWPHSPTGALASALLMTARAIFLKHESYHVTPQLRSSSAFFSAIRTKFRASFHAQASLPVQGPLCICPWSHTLHQSLSRHTGLPSSPPEPQHSCPGSSFTLTFSTYGLLHGYFLLIIYVPVQITAFSGTFPTTPSTACTPSLPCQSLWSHHPLTFPHKQKIYLIYLGVCCPHPS